MRLALTCAGLATLAGAISGCTRAPLCVPGVHEDEVYVVDVLGPYDLQTPGFNAEWVNRMDPPCVGLDGLTAGARFKIWPQNRVVIASCDGLSATAMDVPDVTLAGQAGPSNSANRSGAFMRASHQATTRSGCAGSWGLVFKGFGATVDNDAVFREPSATQHPGLLVERWYIPAAGQPATCQRCSDTFVSKLER